jgi:wyosine [tRNA(Phe)-imidazoG37] synthetase (radical SAM superfamily)
MENECSILEMRPGNGTAASAFAYPRNFLGNRCVYVTISPRAKGLSIGVNLNPDQRCNFNCIYCEVPRANLSLPQKLDLKLMTEELQKTLVLVRSGAIRNVSPFSLAPDSLLELKHVALSGDGEPTLSEDFAEAVQEVMHVRARSSSYFKILLITNASGFDLANVQTALGAFTRHDEIWAKLDGGTQDYLQRINGMTTPIEKILSNILLVAKQRPVVIQSLFPSINGVAPAPEEILQYALRLRELKNAGAQIPLVQIYSATRPVHNPECGHLPLKTLSQIAKTVREVAGLKTEVF